MANLTFERAVETIVGMKGEIIQALGETFIMVGLSTTFAVIFGTILGVLLFVTSSHQLHYNKQLNLFLNNIVNLVRAFPFVILMIAMIPITRAIIGTSIGPIAASLVLSISGLFYFARLVEQNLREVPRGVIEAASAMGASPMSIIYKVLLNEARAGMVSSITVLSIQLLSYSRGGRYDWWRRLGRLCHPLRLLPLSNGSYHLSRRHPAFTRYPDSRHRQQIGTQTGQALSKQAV